MYALRERSFEYDRAGNLTHMRHGWHSRDETLGTFTYTYDPLGQLLSAGQRDLDEVFAFDPAGNLLDPGPERSVWEQQARVWEKPPAAPMAPVTHNLLKRYQDSSYEYDGQGNTIRKVYDRASNPNAKVELELGYDAENRLVRAVKTSYQARHSAQYIYDAFSRRIAKRVTEERWGNNQVCYEEPAAKTTHHMALFVWDGDAMVQELRQGDTVTYLYEPDSFVPLARIASAGGFALDEDAARAEALAPGAGGSAAFHLARIASWHLPSINGDKEKQAATATAEAAAEELHLAARRQLEAAANDAAPRDRIDLYSCDHLGTPHELFDGQGRLVWSAKYKAWGKVFDEKSQEIEQPLRFQGQYHDAETGLHFNRFRYFNSDIGRFISQDPIGLLGGINTYIYGDANPINKTDPLGLATFMCTKPLHALGGDGAKSGADTWGNPLYHQYLCVSDGKGEHICGGQDQRGKKWYDPLNGPGKPSNDSYDKITCKQEEPDNNCIEKCLLTKFNGPRPRYGIPFGTDCQEWSNDALKQCQKQCKGK
ncbi:RHS repeat domain-containing protein [Rugamonas sp. DEMB1]|uniref:RHS repeat domain-containing protein n=1 Tax=Rugamonas sp. DEMB1 TaxID=3039386 RepID=UPI00244B4D12|nr:RHS repeat-associated core domain-containing protein [Rugamonas sp. DEMB1]WGG51440.1 RHS repeat-associated core domain-containing protein [Rugamonas sp. DEMB1]